MSNLHFAAPEHIHWIWLLLAVGGVLAWLEHRGSNALDRLLSRVMRSRLVARPSRTRRLLRIGLLTLTGLALIVALMRPQFGMRFVRTPRVGAEVMVCLDVSKSMLAADVAPNRLERAKVEIDDLLRYLDGDHVGLIAFAGKATVLCPMTPDFGFLKLSLKNAGPQSVPRGGTNLGAPIRKAIAGFRGEADVSRAILLITDGEDHDSLPLDAARAAGERGIRILAIGFGDEAGSEIRVEDARTGARETLRDADGKPVISRLDGEMLREMALATGGAYIPAGTGALDLESIHEAHIARLTRGEMDGRGRVVRSEGFQWAVLAGLMLLVASVAVTGARRRRGSPTPAVILLVACLLVASGVPAHADETEAPVATKPPADDGADARTRYNLGVDAFEAGDLDEAARHFESARRATGSDGEARYAAAYDLGWVAVRRAEAKLESEPEQALKQLHAAADWFRDAVRLRPKRAAARKNLDIVTRRILELADALAKQDPRDVAAKVDALIKMQRALMPALAEAVERERTATSDASTRGVARSEYRRLAVEQRKVLADLGRLAGKVREEAEALALRKQDEQTPESRVRAVQLTNSSHFLERASQRLSQGRSQLRRKQAPRAFRRGSAGLDELKRARDQFRPPVELLGVLIGEGTQLVRWTGGLAAVEAYAGGPPGAEPEAGEAQRPKAPSWLDVDHLRERQVPQSERLAEFTSRLEAALEGHAKSKQERGKGEQVPPEEAQAEKFLAQVREALPFLEEAGEAYEGVPLALAAGNLRSAFEAQGEALTALVEARERFLDIKGLVELTYVEEKRIQKALQEALEMDAVPLDEVLPLLSDLQRRNVERGPRLAALLAEERAKLPEVPEKTEPGNEEARKKLEVQHKRLEVAEGLRGRAGASMDAALGAIRRAVAIPAGTDPEALAEAPPVQGAREHIGEAVDHLEALRRLFFDVVEHLRETLRRQLELNDDTQDLAALEDESEQPAALSPIGETQAELRAIAQAISEALEKQAAQPPGGAPAGPPDPKAAQQMKKQAEAMRQAAGLVAEGGGFMDTVLGQFRAEPPGLEPAREAQDTAAEKLAEALALLQPPEQKQQQQQQQQQPQPKEEQKKQDKQEKADPGRLLQAVRDREAQRRKEKEKRRPGGYEPVEKDW